MANKLPSPTPAEILSIRQAAGLTQAQAAARVYASSYRTWQDWERGVRTMPVAIWELWKLQDSSAANKVVTTPGEIINISDLPIETKNFRVD